MTPLYTPKENAFECKTKLLLGCQGCIFSRSCAQFDRTLGNLDAAVHSRGDYKVAVFDMRKEQVDRAKALPCEEKRRGC